MKDLNLLILNIEATKILMLSDLFLSDLNVAPFDEALTLGHGEFAYKKFKQLYSEVVEKHTPLKHRVPRGNQASFMTKDLTKQIMILSRLRNKFNKVQIGIHTKLSVISVSQSG